MAEPVPAVLAEHLAAHVAAGRDAERLLPEVHAVARRLIEAFATGRRVYTFGNGGSAADAQHLAAELIGHYRRDRRPLPALALSSDPSVVTCIANDYAFEDVFARQVEALAGPGDVVIGFSTSGRSPNVVAGLAAGRAAGATTVLFTGREGGGTGPADLVLAAPADGTARVQELHVLFLHLVSELVDAWAGDGAGAP
jgi:D-sedoheptulose 7-phosphate isomerase